MSENSLQKNQIWAAETFALMQKKLFAECKRMGEKIPYIPENGVYPDYGEIDLPFWTNGFWGGILWQMYHSTQEPMYAETARALERRLDGAMADFVGLHHDVGFMWLHTAVANYRLTQNEQSKKRALHAATLLAGRYNPAGHFISAWNENRPGWMIIDCMMNVPLLYWATQETGDPCYEAVALQHTETVMKYLMRPDGSAHHIAVLDPATGELLDYPEGQGYASGSSWSRGQAWAIYGFAISYRHQKDERYLNIAKSAAHYFLANTARSGHVPLVDFRAPTEPVMYDSTAAVCAACGLLEISEHVSEYEKPLYVQGAMDLLQATTAKFADWNEASDGILGGGTVAYHRKGEVHVPIIYGDYFLLEAVLRLLKKDFFIW